MKTSNFLAEELKCITLLTADNVTFLVTLSCIFLLVMFADL